MTKKWLGFALVVLALLLPRISGAGCKSDCLDEYQSARQECVLLYSEPDDADDLQMCVENAKATYDDCIEECES